MFKFTFILQKLFLFLILIQNYYSLKPQTIELQLNSKNNFFTLPIKIGSNNDLFEVQIDSTTSETWIPSTNVPLPVHKFNAKNSSTCQETHNLFEIEDRNGKVIGFSIYDSVSLGSVKLDKFGLVLVDFLERNSKDYNQGKLGLGYRQDHGVDFNFIGSLKKNGFIEKEIFSIIPDEKKLIIGNIPKAYERERYTKCNLVETNDLDNAFRSGWVCEMTHILFGVDTKNKTLEKAIPMNARAIFDTAYNYISIPFRHLDDFNNKFMKDFYNDSCIQIKELNEIYYICEDDEKIKKGSIAFVLGGFGYVIPWSKLFRKILDEKYEMQIRFHKENDDIFTFGYPFVSQFTLVYNSEDKEVGFFRGERINVTRDWDIYMIGETPEQKKEKMKKLLIYSSIIGGILFFIIIFLVIRSSRKANLERNSMIQREMAP